MREFKFRAWDNKNKIMTAKVSLSDVSKGFLGLENNVVMQYTGLKDKNGVELYEGDIVKDDEGRFFEVKEDLRFAKTGYIMSCIKNKLNDHINLGGFYDFWSWMYPDNYIEAIGNIYENPELLES